MAALGSGRSDKAVQLVVERFGGLDIVVNNAGVGRGARDPNVPQATGGLGAEMSAAAWDEYLSQNLRTTFVTTKAAPHDIRVNAICPGFLWTRAWEGLAAAIKQRTPEYAALAVDGGITLRQAP